MRKLIINLFAFSLYFRVFNFLINIPRVVVALFTTTFLGILLSFTSIGYTSSVILNILYWLPLFLAVFGVIYLKIKPVKWNRDKEKLTLQQKYHFLGLLVHYKHLLDYRTEFLFYKKEFNNKYGEFDFKEAYWGSMIIVWLFLLVVGVLFYKFYV